MQLPSLMVVADPISLWGIIRVPMKYRHLSLLTWYLIIVLFGLHFGLHFGLQFGCNAAWFFAILVGVLASVIATVLRKEDVAVLIALTSVLACIVSTFVGAAAKLLG